MTDSGYSQQDPDDGASDFAARQFQIDQTLARVRSMVLVKVTAIQGGAGAIASPGTVTVQPLVKMLDGQGNATSHGTIYAIPVFRLGGGANAVICDPVVGDIGWMAVADRDISAVKATKAEAPPGSRRKFDLADGVYMGSLLSAVPTQYITFTSTGVKIADSNSNVLEFKSAGISINGILINQQGQVAGNLPVNGALQLSGTITGLLGGTWTGNILTTGSVRGSSITNGTVDLAAHHHLAPAGGGNTGGALP